MLFSSTLCSVFSLIGIIFSETRQCDDRSALELVVFDGPDQQKCVISSSFSFVSLLRPVILKACFKRSINFFALYEVSKLSLQSFQMVQECGSFLACLTCFITLSTWQHRSVKYLGIFLTFWVVSGDVLNYPVKEADFQPQNG